MAKHGMLRTGVAVGSLFLALVVSQAAVAQGQQRKPAPNGAVVSPEVLPDHRVIFRIHAPKAAKVTVQGDCGSSDLQKDEKGVWSVVVGPLVPDFYSYFFTVDGVRTLDPKDSAIKPGISGVSIAEVPGEEAAFEATRPGPHGDVRIVWYQSSTLNAVRRVHIYTPPGYDGGKDRYPVLFLLHGAGGDDSRWSTIGRAGFIIDNLLMQEKAKPMIVVMPNGSMPRPAGPPPAAPARPGGNAAQALFANELLKDVIPYVEKNFRVLTDRENRAIAGLSMGGGQTLRVVLDNPQMFGYVAVWSAAGVRSEDTANFEKQNALFLDNPDKVNNLPKIFSISVGTKDTFAYAGSKNLAEILNNHKIKNTYHESDGGHTWINWRHYLNDFAPLLFR